MQLDLRPLVRASVRDLLRGRPVHEISGRFHNAIAAAASELRDRCDSFTRTLPIVLTGGCFQNRLLTERTIETLGSSAAIFFNERVPPGDGGVALGQALIANAAIAGRGISRCA